MKAPIVSYDILSEPEPEVMIFHQMNPGLMIGFPDENFCQVNKIPVKGPFEGKTFDLHCIVLGFS